MITPVIEKLWKDSGILLDNKDIPVTIQYWDPIVSQIKFLSEIGVDDKVNYEALKFDYYYMVRKIKESLKSGSFKLSNFLYKFLNTFGFGRVKFVRFDPSRKMIIEIKNSVYGFAYLREFGKSKRPVCDFIGGALAGVMTAAFEKDMDCKEVKCIASGYSSCVFEVTPARKDVPGKYLKLYGREVNELIINKSGFGDFVSMLLAKRSLKINNGVLTYNGRKSFIASGMTIAIIFGFLERRYSTKKAYDIVSKMGKVLADSEERELKEQRRKIGAQRIKKSLMKAGLKVAEFTKLGIMGGYAMPMNMKFEKVDLKKKYVLMNFDSYVFCHYYKDLFGESKLPLCRLTIYYEKVGFKHMFGWDVDVYHIACHAQGFPSCFAVAISKENSKKDVKKIIAECMELMKEHYNVDEKEVKKVLKKNFEIV